MFECKLCKKKCTSERTFYFHSLLKHGPNAKKYEKRKHPQHSHRGINGYVNINWTLVPFEQLGRIKRRERLLKDANYKCTKCGFSDVFREDKNCILEINHIDGCHTNNKRDNLEVVCPNCHAITEGWSGKQVGVA